MLKKIGVLSGLLLTAAATAAYAQEAPSGFSAQGSVAGRLLIGGLTVSLGSDIALFNRGPQFRVDISRLMVPGSDPTMNALLQQFLPQGAFTVVLDRTAKTTTIWSAEKRMYYVMSPASATTATATTSPMPPNLADAGSMMQMLKSIKDYSIYELTMRLSGKGNVNGHPVTTLQFSVRTQKRGGPLSSMAGDVSLADDEQGLPVRVTSTLQGKNIKGTFRLDFRTVSASAPDASSFAVPDGFTKASDPSQLFGNIGSSKLNPP